VGNSSRYGVARRSVKRAYLEVGFTGFSSVVGRCSRSWRRKLRPSAPRRALGESGFRFHRVVTAQEEPKTSSTATPKRSLKFLGRSINSFSHFFNSSVSMFVVNPHFGHTTSGFFSRSETLICVALPQAWHLIGNSASPKRSDSISKTFNAWYGAPDRHS
jgi:hypothetical protein